jgi:hypothetical protein
MKKQKVELAVAIIMERAMEMQNAAKSPMQELHATEAVSRRITAIGELRGLMYALTAIERATGIKAEECSWLTDPPKDYEYQEVIEVQRSENL